MRHADRTCFRLRVLEGPLEGATYHLRDSFVLGRSGACDLALLNRRVSRLHAKVSRDAAGRHVLSDLGSANGTRVNREPIRERVLAVGDEIAVGEFRFVYERIPAGPAANGPDAAPPRAGDTATLRAAYDGDLLADVIAYRSLAAPVIRGEALDEESLSRLRALDRKLRDPAAPERFRELPCALGARLRPAWDETDAGEDVRLCALGVGGTTLYTPRRPLAPQDVMHLILEGSPSGASRALALTGVVTAVGPVMTELGFSMCAGWAERLASYQRAATVRVQVPVALQAALRAALEDPARAPGERASVERTLHLVR